ncbi:hypothetical protein COLO4_29071 [Corchorus olitorius]|uniref:Uncharacterized protein n=1 Tax=Corchorus olitorius TaxID=93759 RepID=A0A1R3HGH4_9ROSI|nr:hypothetical protein COLO4_29071 [Corchorus olitorius]
MEERMSSSTRVSMNSNALAMESIEGLAEEKISL